MANAARDAADYRIHTLMTARQAISGRPGGPAPHPEDAGGPRTADDVLQADLLTRVSRTFALTIPQLPHALRRVVSNAYLLCRIVDTIEDEAMLVPADKRRLCTQFAAVVAGRSPAGSFADELAPRLSSSTPPGERALICETPRVIAITHGFSAAQQQALRACVEVMAEGMASFQEARTGSGLADLTALDRYCYCVAGVVGEMLTRLFCDYSPAIAKHRDALMPLAVSFGQGLQMTNILKDIWEDRQRGACWLPQDVFRESGFDLACLGRDPQSPAFERGLERLLAIAHGHLEDALRYTLLIPKDETAIRHFCLWAIGMALLTLRKIDANRAFTRSAQVKISRRSVKLVIVASRLSVRSAALLKALFRLAAFGLPKPVRRRNVRGD
ncbi:MAG: sqs [Betaproteobacteria bacterium]|nr:sqs [Betaproteobacteria bacterium]